MTVFEAKESVVRSYCRSFPVTFNRAKGSFLYSESGNQYIDFLAGAGSLNYGHNNDAIKQKIKDYIDSDNIIHGLDLHTSAKAEFIQTFDELILKPRDLQYKLQFCGPTGTNAVEAAIKIARKTTGRRNVFAFMGAYHGMTLGALALTGNKYHRDPSFPVSDTTFMPYPHGFMKSFDTLAYMEAVLSDPSSGVDLPAAVIVETVQAEGGVVVAPVEWLQGLRKLCDKFGIYLIIDDIQVGCYRSGDFFSFERANIKPDMVVLSKSLGGYGLPVSLLCLTEELDKNWLPGEHNGTFRGNQLAFVAATAALKFADDNNLSSLVKSNERLIAEYIDTQISVLNPQLAVRGIGMIWALDCSAFAEETTSAILNICFANGLIVERAGRNDTAIKIMPPLTTESSVLMQGLDILRDAIKVVIGE
ncbi:diaminobutyrate--2-oxoglutarate transaminase [Saccharobesus litoralis]|uniref:Diaminobutyrate--2-oxoglutarate transaminase n=1 Tax=Saccharobesus litoralis TaxID=2172099 RepID=A0A2S0VNA0_9ALTE|nr:diaminobutyrate--2-oxoglutarate transaminase [Saccharobesus litoralis]AWB65697.1 diaminobutyrate--2-oxoglutarate transaminase [Saccharobesus litoralis]